MKVQLTHEIKKAMVAIIMDSMDYHPGPPKSNVVSSPDLLNERIGVQVDSLVEPYFKIHTSFDDQNNVWYDIQGVLLWRWTYDDLNEFLKQLPGAWMIKRCSSGHIVIGCQRSSIVSVTTLLEGTRS